MVDKKQNSKTINLLGIGEFRVGIYLENIEHKRDPYGRQFRTYASQMPAIKINSVERRYDDPENPEYSRSYHIVRIKEDKELRFIEKPSEFHYDIQEHEQWKDLKVGDVVPVDFMIWLLWRNKDTREMLLNGTFQIEASEDTISGIKMAMGTPAGNHTGMPHWCVGGDRSLLGGEFSNFKQASKAMSQAERDSLSAKARIAEAKAEEAEKRAKEAEAKLAELEGNTEPPKETKPKKETKAKTKKEEKELAGAK